MLSRLTDRASKIMGLAIQEAQRSKHDCIAPEHILLGLLAEGTGVGASVLKNLNVDDRRVRAEVEKLSEVGTTEARPRESWEKLRSNLRANRVLERASLEAKGSNHSYVGSEHLLLGLLHERDGVVAAVFSALGLELDRVRQEVLDVLGASVTDAPSSEAVTKKSVVYTSEAWVEETSEDPWPRPNGRSLEWDSELLRSFLHARDADCPRCGYNLRNLIEPRCPECGEALTLKVSAQRPIFGLFWVTILPGILSGVCALVLLVLLQFDPQVPPAVWWVDLFGFASGISVLALFIYRRAFSRCSEQAQLTVAVIVWLVHVVVFLVLARTY